jgi:hypothetical protein
MPAAHRAHMEWTPQRLIHWGESIGPATAEAVTRLMVENRHPEHGYRACLGLLSLGIAESRQLFHSTTPSRICSASIPWSRSSLTASVDIRQNGPRQ